MCVSVSVRMRRHFPEEFGFVPQTWVLPSEYNAIASTLLDLKRHRRKKTFIVKPHNSSMGNG